VPEALDFHRIRRREARDRALQAIRRVPLEPLDHDRAERQHQQHRQRHASRQAELAVAPSQPQVQAGEHGHGGGAERKVVDVVGHGVARAV
jgi:hypothetical protein